MKKSIQIESIAKAIAKEVIDQMSDDDKQGVRDKGSESWSEGIGQWPMWTDDPVISALSYDDKTELKDEILFEIEWALS